MSTQIVRAHDEDELEEPDSREEDDDVQIIPPIGDTSEG